MANYLVLTLDLNTVVIGKELVPPGLAYSQVYVASLSTGGQATLQFGDQGGKQIPVSFSGQSFVMIPPEGRGLYFTNAVGQFGRTVKLYIAFTAATPYDSTGFATGIIPGPFKLQTFRALYRLAARPYALLVNTPVGNQELEVATISHSAKSMRTVRVRHWWVAMEQTSAAVILAFTLTRLLTEPTVGNPVIAAQPADLLTAGGPEATLLALPTNAGAFLSTDPKFGFEEFNLSATAGTNTVNPPHGLEWIDLVALPGYSFDDQGQLPTLLAGNVGGFAVTLDSNAASAVKFFSMIEFTEEIP